MPFTMTVIVPAVILRGNIPEVKTDWVIAAIILGLIGLGLFIETLRLFISVGRGTLAPWNATHKLVVRGPYRYTRNPMITAVFFILLAEALALWSQPLLIWAISFFAFNTLYFILKEEPDLEQKFGAAYRHYKRHVPRWLPRLTPYTRNE